MRRLLARRELPVSVRSMMASTSSGALTSVAPPTELDLGLDPVLGQVAVGDADGLGGDALAFQVLGAANGGVGRNRQHPAHGAHALLGVEQLADLVDLRVVFHDPVVPGQTGVQQAEFHVMAHFLGADEADRDVLVVDRRHVRPVALLDVEPPPFSSGRRSTLRGCLWGGRESVCSWGGSSGVETGKGAHGKQGRGKMSTPFHGLFHGVHGNARAISRPRKAFSTLP
jgi:hypothetical protein